jgi:hypothetical protein
MSEILIDLELNLAEGGYLNKDHPLFWKEINLSTLIKFNQEPHRY